MNDSLSSQKDGVSITDSRAEIQLSHASHPPFLIGICHYLGLHRTSGTGEAHRERWEGYDAQPAHCLHSLGRLRETFLPRGMGAIPFSW